MMAVFACKLIQASRIAGPREWVDRIVSVDFFHHGVIHGR
jgi:hypothetical protein